jgi:hypothetical protein
MSPTLADVYMITGLGVTETVYPYKYKGSSRQTGVRTGVGYKKYIQNYMSDVPLSDVEYRAFLNMWLCRFIFCGKANEATLNHIVMVEDLAAGTPIPLEKYLLGSVYHIVDGKNSFNVSIGLASVQVTYTLLNLGRSQGLSIHGARGLLALNQVLIKLNGKPLKEY